MELVNAVLLICAAAIPRAECQPETALDVIVAPDATTVGLCGFQSQAYLASMRLSKTLGKGTYLKIQCKMGRRAIIAAPDELSHGPPHR